MNLIILYVFLIIVIFTILGAKFDFKKVGFLKSLIITCILVVAGIFTGILPMYVGKCGDKAWYTYNIYNTARIHGKGKIALYAFNRHYTLDANGKSQEAKTNLVPEKLKKVVIGKGITELDAEAFAHYTNLETIKFSNTVTSIGDSSFSGCSSLTKIENIDNVIYIGKCAFLDCVKLNEITIPNGVSEIKASTFKNCVQLRQISLPNNLKSIESCAFLDCNNLNKIDLPNGLNKIESYAFENCTSLKEITIPESVTIIGKRPFFGCEKLKDIYIIGKIDENDDKWSEIYTSDDDGKIELGGSSDRVVHWDE